MTVTLHNQDTYIEGFIKYVTASPSSYHAAQSAAHTLTGEGFTEHHETDPWQPISAHSRGYVIRDGAIIAWRAGAKATPTSPMRILGAHTDSPGLVLKPHPDFTSNGWAQAAVEVYGGPLLNSWLDRDLGIAGRIVTREGEEHLVRTGAVARIPQLAIHLDRETHSTLTLDPQQHTQAVLGLAGTNSTPISQILANAAKHHNHASPDSEAPTNTDPSEQHPAIHPENIAAADVRLFDTQPPARIGNAGDLLASPRLDNLSSVYAGLVALITSTPDPDTITIFAAFDHEETGSATRSGAAGPFLTDTIARLQKTETCTTEDAARALSASWCLSADAGHCVHPNYGEKHDPNVRPQAGGGPMLKVNAQQRYASDAHGASLWQRVCNTANVPTQVFVSHNALACGSTIGPLTATRTGIRTVDVGVPLLSMHSARELAHVDDMFGIALAISAFYAGA